MNLSEIESRAEAALKYPHPVHAAMLVRHVCEVDVPELVAEVRSLSRALAEAYEETP